MDTPERDPHGHVPVRGASSERAGNGEAPAVPQKSLPASSSGARAASMGDAAFVAAGVGGRLDQADGFIRLAGLFLSGPSWKDAQITLDVRSAAKSRVQIGYAVTSAMKAPSSTSFQTDLIR